MEHYKNIYISNYTKQGTDTVSLLLAIFEKKSMSCTALDLISEEHALISGHALFS